MLDFLADNYVWFFVVAIVLVFALIGFIVQSKNKAKKNEFKGDNVSEGVQGNTDVVMNDIPTTNEPVQNVNEPVEQKLEILNEIPSIPSNNEVGSMPNNMNNENVSAPTIGETIQAGPQGMVGEPVVSTENTSMPNATVEPTVGPMPETLYDQPLMPQQNQTETMSFEINNDNNQNNVN